MLRILNQVTNYWETQVNYFWSKVIYMFFVFCNDAHIPVHILLVGSSVKLLNQNFHDSI